MGSLDNITWQVLTVLLTLGGLLATVVFWRRRGAVAGLRILALALLPAAAYLTGTLRLLWEIGDAFTRWAVRLTFSPTVWVGVALAALSVLLFVVTGLLRRRGAGGAAPSPALTRDTSRPSARPSARPEKPAAGKGAAEGDQDDDMADIEEILKRHGIS